jgi:hypothetical protein
MNSENKTLKQLGLKPTEYCQMILTKPPRKKSIWDLEYEPYYLRKKRRVG